MSKKVKKVEMVEKPEHSKCQNCGMVVKDEDLEKIDDVFDQVSAGEPIPSGQCPTCGRLAHPTDEPVTIFKFRLTMNITINPHGETEEIIRDRLLLILERAMNNGAVTGDGNAEVENYDQKVTMPK